MEQRSRLAVGMGISVGLGLASARLGKPAHVVEGGGGGAGGSGVMEVEAELRRLVVDDRNSDVSFDEFHNLHHYLSPYLQSLARAPSHHYKDRLLLLDIIDFLLQIQNKYGRSRNALVHIQSWFNIDGLGFMQTSK